jgi:uridylate kinase
MPAYQRILLKFSGEVLMGRQEFGWDMSIIEQVAEQVKAVRAQGVEIGLVIGGGNVFRGAQVQSNKIARSTADQMGMLATLMNGVALRDVLQAHGIPTRLMSAWSMDALAETFNADAAKKALAQGDVVIFAGGSGNPFFTTDTAAALRGIEIQADVVLKATKVDGIYTRDPNKFADAERLQALTYEQVIQQDIAVMDLAAFALCREHAMPIRVFDMLKPGALARIIAGEDEGTLVSKGEA